VAEEGILEDLLGRVVRFCRPLLRARIKFLLNSVLPRFLVRMRTQKQFTGRFKKFIELLHKVAGKLRHRGTISLDMLKTLKTCLRKAHELRCPGNKKWALKEQFLDAGLNGSLISQHRTIIVKVHNLARYFEVCKDLLQLARSYPTLFSEIEVFACAKPEAEAGGKVHTEMWIISHYRVNQLDRPPRAIGCSKRACFLCHWFIRIDGMYQTVGANNRLYSGWAPPAAESLGEGVCEERARLERLRSDLKRNADRGLNRSFPNESFPPSQV
jgi:hypothetical protein